MIETLKYVPHEDIPQWQALGWVNLGPISPYSVLMLWPFESEAEVPV